MYPWLCVSLLVPYSLGDHAQLGGGSIAERFRSKPAYGWEERCSDVAGCGTSYYEISNLVYFTSIIPLMLMIMMNMLNACMNVCFLPLYDK